MLACYVLFASRYNDILDRFIRPWQPYHLAGCEPGQVQAVVSVYLAGNAEEKMSSDFRRFASACVKRGGTKVEPISASVMQSFIASRSVGRDAYQKSGPMMLPYRNGIDYLARKRNAGYSGRRWARQATFQRAESSRLSRRRTVCKGYLGCCCCCLIRAFRPRVRCNARRRCRHPVLPFIHTN